jgi:hypothetical protein
MVCLDDRSCSTKVSNAFNALTISPSEKAASLFVPLLESELDESVIEKSGKTQ